MFSPLSFLRPGDQIISEYHTEVQVSGINMTGKTRLKSPKGLGEGLSVAGVGWSITVQDTVMGAGYGLGHGTDYTSLERQINLSCFWQELVQG